MSGSSFLDNSNFGSSFLNGIEDIGLGGVGPPKKAKPKVEEKKPPPKSTSSNTTTKKSNDTKGDNKGSKTTSSKPGGPKRGPRAPLMNLGDLTSILPPATTPIISPIQKSTADPFQIPNTSPNSTLYNPIQIHQMPQTPPILTMIENRLTSSLQASLKNLAAEFIQTLPTLFPDDDLVSQAVTSCVSDLQDKIRSIITFNVEQNPNTNNVNSIFASYAPLFRDLYFEAEKAKGKDYSVFDNSIREARASANSASTAFQTQIQEGLDEFTALINDLNYSRMNYETAARSYQKNHSHLLETYNTLEIRKAELDADAEIIEMKKRHLESEQDKNNTTAEIDITDLASIARESLDTIKSSLSADDISQQVSRTSYNIESICDEINQMRHIKYYQMQDFQDQITMATSVTYTYNTQRQIADDTAIPAIESSVIEEDNASVTPSQELKKKLRSISIARRESLQKATDFMDNVRRGERRRSRKQVTDISLLSSV
ncbi:hypothetical protein TVAG_458750 [Trichomonas vaginalis G3]|uniref:Uncharacterized protein n=1 Tax=Trichomonas vaginalis (strain ATCC PRA-98 / G3) TaxID=412133 RepID=A2E680_TRIV3|nr:hypothetical protein TVAGG3_0394180 [Trichomonas vaginalis G3]EAY11803.1 hypothetical protein TVAG_458750 [Trichomonas vaginalis G3]KAI5534209.1 hypothetical protein TVAGG3_0394180 [Trichomonas vaginalis G3]|eukprot:XP_001324026.1 hypothetical protein [Trichomonas vaginalis G3]